MMMTFVVSLMSFVLISITLYFISLEIVKTTYYVHIQFSRGPTSSCPSPTKKQKNEQEKISPWVSPALLCHTAHFPEINKTRTGSLEIKTRNE